MNPLNSNTCNYFTLQLANGVKGYQVMPPELADIAIEDCMPDQIELYNALSAYDGESMSLSKEICAITSTKEPVINFSEWATFVPQKRLDHFSVAMAEVFPINIYSLDRDFLLICYSVFVKNLQLL